MSCLTSFGLTVYGFAVAYMFLAHLDSKAFSLQDGGRLGFVTALYFSAQTAATVGFGDLTPESTAAKVLVLVEILVTFLYVVLLFSAVPTALREIMAHRDHGGAR